MQKTCVIISGATGVGKTRVAIELAKQFSTEIISADSRQCYKELNIGVAKPTTIELAEVSHHFISSHSIHHAVTAADFETSALNAVGEIFTSNDIAIVCGGTGLYIKAFCEGLDAIPVISQEIRQEIIAQYNNTGINYLQDSLNSLDPLFVAQGEMQNPQRMMRALEVMISTGRSILSYHSEKRKTRDFNIINFVLELTRPELYKRINHRVDEMMKTGLEAEARALIESRHLTPMQTVGYQELFEFFDGNVRLETAVEKIKQHSRNYAKRQVTWFSKETDAIHIPPNSVNALQILKEKRIV